MKQDKESYPSTKTRLVSVIKNIPHTEIGLVVSTHTSLGSPDCIKCKLERVFKHEEIQTHKEG